MTVLLQNRSISMILTVPDVDASPSPSLSVPNIEQVDQCDTVPSMPVYHGSIIHVEPHNDDRNTLDLIIRIPNFQHSSFPTNDMDAKQQTSIKRRAPICPILNNSNVTNTMESMNQENIHRVNIQQSRMIHSNRLTTGLRSLSRAFTHSCRSKRTESITEITFPRSLPDVEVITEKCESSLSKKTPKEHTFSITNPKLTPPKILFIKRKDLEMKKRQVSSSSSSSIDIQPNLKHKRLDQASTSTIITTQYSEITRSNTPKVTSFLQGLNEQNNLTQPMNISQDDNHDEMESTSLTYEVEQQLKAICQLVSDQPVSSIDADSLSTHRYSSISAMIRENPSEEISSPDESSVNILPTVIEISENIDKQLSSKSFRPFRIQTSILQPDISVVRIGTSNLTTRTDHILPGEIDFNDKQKIEKIIEEDYSDEIQSNEEIFAECYEVTYQVDENEQIISQVTNPNEIILNPSDYQQIDSDLSDFSYHQYKQQSNDQDILIKTMKSEDLSQTNHEQLSVDPLESICDSSSSDRSYRHCTLQRSNSYDGLGVYISTDIETCREHYIQQVEHSSPGDQAGLKDNDRILCINGTSVIEEDYTVVLQLIKHGLETDTLDFDVMSNDAYEEFRSQMNSTS
ncbi:hypothetical protein I4U23_017804 [Adineta vaga]|nr:hypothetical protein I4U23_017804 [Adineta vaga]